MDATPENPYRAPAAELLSTEDRAVGPLYRMSAVGIATFFGTPLAGAYIMAHNLRALGQQDRVRNAWWMGIGLFALVMVIGYWLPDGASMGLTVAQVIGMHQYAKSLYGEAVAGHLGGLPVQLAGIRYRPVVPVGLHRGAVHRRDGDRYRRG